MWRGGCVKQRTPAASQAPTTPLATWWLKGVAGCSELAVSSAFASHRALFYKDCQDYLDRL
jgi:hypothetical protein